jgi:DNA topoisomerase-1
MKQLIHNGVLLPKKYEPKGFSILINGKKVDLTPEQEEMAVVWVKKLGTEYVNDPVFVRNFFKDFCDALGLEEQVAPEDFDFSEIQRYVEQEKNLKLTMSKEEKKRLAEARKAIREENKGKYGYAIVDGQRVEVGNYVVEPPCIFMGRGKHPLRGRWKAGAGENDIILNLSPDAPRPDGNWKEIVWQPDSMWIAKWDDKLRGVEKYLWLSDSSHVKQRREIEKFEKARELESRINSVKAHIGQNLQSNDLLRRKIATVCYLIDKLKLRVGDEKDRDEADTVGATTLRPQHIRIMGNGLVKFDFLGKDSVRWRKEVELPSPVVDNLEQFIAGCRSVVFKGVDSERVKLFLSEAVPDLTAKVFRTYHASKVVREYLASTKTSKSDPEYVKKHLATMANLQAAIVCNHKKKIPKKWRESLMKKIQRLRKLKSQRTKKSEEAAKALKVKIETAKATREYNLNTSLKSYIDPRIYYEWGKKTGFDWRLYYPKTLQRKFSWVEGKTSKKS